MTEGMNCQETLVSELLLIRPDMKMENTLRTTQHLTDQIAHQHLAWEALMG